jgi:two-component system chemotaxis response regulator CheB
MGVDGLEGARAIRDAGGTILTQSEESCVVFGMPRAVVSAGLSTMSVSIGEMAAAIVDHL